MIIETAFYNIKPYPNLLCIETFQAWDERTVKKHVDDVRRAVCQCYPNKPWGLLSDRSAWQLSTPEAERLFTETALSALNDNLTHIAIVAGGSQIKEWQLSNMTSAFSKYEVRFFRAIQNAETWLESYGYANHPRPKTTLSKEAHGIRA